MKILNSLNLNRKFDILEKAEFVFATLLFVIGLVAVLSDDPSLDGALLGVYYLNEILLISLFYLSFLLLNFVVIPTIDNRKYLEQNLGLIAFIVGMSIIIYPDLDDNPLLLGLFTYFILKFLLLFMWRRLRKFSREKGTFPAGILVAVLFYLLLMFMFLGEKHLGALAIPGILIPFSIGLYALSFYKLLPKAMEKARPVQSYILKVFLVLIASGIPLGLVTYLLTEDEDLPAIVVMLNFPLQLFITSPISWYVYRQHEKGKEEVQKLQTELGQSMAKFDFLRSQINPHFLFNALNNLYGTAIQEKADRTSEGIQMLGDMMRFMLHENMKEKISLQREIEYLENYIRLQRLRTDSNLNVDIRIKIQQDIEPASISPMLLIPFVENAFKHGISFRESSHINIALERKENTLYFDVYNSKHPLKEDDPEKKMSGIGLENVKQRLKMLYPSKHELLIRENSKEYFVHLNLEL